MLHDTTIIFAEESAIQLVERLLALQKELVRQTESDNASNSRAPQPLRDYMGTLHANLIQAQSACETMIGILEFRYGFEGANKEPQYSDTSRTPTWHPV